MPNPVCISPLKFYDSLAKQSHHKNYAYDHISPLITKTGWIPPFQFVIPTQDYINGTEESSNIANPANIFDGYVSSDGSITAGPSYTDAKCIEVSVQAGQVISFGNFTLDKYGIAYYSFWNGRYGGGGSVVSSGGLTKGALNKIENISVPAGATTLYVTLRQSPSSAPDSAYAKFMCNYGATLLSYVPYGGIVISEFSIYEVKTNEIALSLSQGYIANNISIYTLSGHKVLVFKGNTKLNSLSEGIYYLKLSSGNGGLWTYYSEVFCFTNVTKDCLELEYWNETGNFAIKNGVITFSSGFHFSLLLKTEIGKPEYNFEEESTKRLGYVYVESQVSKKTYKFNVVVPEYICDALRIVRLCDNKIIRCKDDEYEAITFEMEAEWQTQGDLASVTCEFETDNVVANIGGFVPDKPGGDYNNDYNKDFDKE